MPTTRPEQATSPFINLIFAVSPGNPGLFSSCTSAEERIRYTPLRWAELFYSTAFILLAGVLDLAGVKDDSFLPFCYYMEEGIDPNVNRKRLLTP